MKLSYSTRGWYDFSFEKNLELCREAGFQGFELAYFEDSIASVLSDISASAARQSLIRSLNEFELEIPCISAGSCLGDPSRTKDAVARAQRCIELARLIHTPYVHLRGDQQGYEFSEICLTKALSLLLPMAQENNVTLLIETSGVFSDTLKLRDFLNRYACDSLAAVWDLHHTHRFGNESPELSIQNLGAYVKHVHVRDSILNSENEAEYCLIGDGDLPVKETIDALRSIDYKGFLSLIWPKSNETSFHDEKIVFPYYVNYMNRFISQNKKPLLYHNKTGTGLFCWPKNELLPLTFSQVLDHVTEAFPDQYAFRYTTLDYTRTYSEFRDDVDYFARALVSLGVGPGSKVAVWATNIPQWYICFWATVKLGAVLVTVNTAYKTHEAEYLLRQSDTHTLVMIESYRDSNYSQIIRELCPELENSDAQKPLHCEKLPFLRRVITVGFQQNGCLTWDDALKFAQKTPVEEVYRRAAKVHPDDVCNMQYTSGTTGFPKGVMLTHRNIINNGKCIGDRMDLSTADRMMIQVPMFHCFGMVLAMTASMTHSAMLSPLPYFSPKSALYCINQERITCFHGVPTMFIALLQHEDFEKTDFSHMRTGIMAGSPCPISVMQDVVTKMHMSEITIVYGQTEASPGCTMSSTDDSLEVRVATVGRPLPEIECKIVDAETWEDLPDGENGEFVARGYNIMKGYYKMPQATASVIDKNGWLHTGDLACRTPEGNFKITGRLKDMIIRGGENIYPKEIEEFLYTHPKIQDVQVIGVPDEQYGEEIMACVILRDGEELTEKELKAFVEASMAKHKVPRYVSFMDEFPMNAAGKILKYKMREDAAERLGLKGAGETA